MPNKTVGQTSLDLEADRLLAVVRADMMVLSNLKQYSDDNYREEFRNNVAGNLKALGEIIAMGANPDPYPYFRHGEERTVNQSLALETAAKEIIAFTTPIPDKASSYVTNTALANLRRVIRELP